VGPEPEAPEAETKREVEAATALLESLQKAQTPEAFLVGLLHIQVERFEALHGAVWLPGQASGESVRLLREEPARVGQQAAEGWRLPLARQASAVFVSGSRHVERISEPADRLLQGRPYWSLGLPVPIGQRVFAAVTLVVTGSEQHALACARLAAEAVASQGLLYGTLQAGQELQERYDELCQAWDIIAASNAGYPNPDHMAQAVVNKAKEFLDVQRVSLGWVRHGKVKLAAISDQDYIDRRTNLSRALVGAMEEALEAEEAVCFPPQETLDEDPSDLFPAHALLADLAEAHSIATVPLRAGEDVAAVMVFERRDARPFSAKERRLQGIACEQLGPALALARQNARGPLARLRDGVTWVVERLLGKGHVVAKLVAVGVLAVAAVGIFGRMELKISAPAQLAPATRRVYSAPFDGAVLRETMVLPGQLVRTGDVLFRFETEDLQIALRQARAELAETRAKREVYFAEQRMAEVRIADAECERLEARIALLTHRINQAEVRATFDGVVLTGDLRQHIGSPFQMGQTLIEVAPLDELLLLAQVSQGDVAHLRVGQRGTFATKARPAQTLDFTVEKIRPMAEAHERANVFVVEAKVRNGPVVLREDEVADWRALAAKLLEGSKTQRGPLRRTWDFLSDDGRKAAREIAKAQEPTSDQKKRLLEALNTLLGRRDFFDQEAFAGLVLPARARSLVGLDKAALSEHQVHLLNRLVLDAVFGDELEPCRRVAGGWLRPGMEAAAKIYAGKHNVAWVLTRKLVNWLRLKLFF